MGKDSILKHLKLKIFQSSETKMNERNRQYNLKFQF
jgi:hypothetical protein